MSIIWIASYPKSGNTLVRLLLHNYFYGAAEDTNLIDDRIPGLHRLMERNNSLDLDSNEVQLVKSHFLFSDKHPYVEHTFGFIYILRNPCDVLLSNARYFGEHTSAEALKSFANSFIDQHGVQRWREMGFGTWPSHIASFLTAAVSIPHYFIKYEDLRTDTESCLTDMVRFLGHSPDSSSVRKAVLNSSIARCREQEKMERKKGRGGIYNVLPNGGSFIGEGRMGQTLEAIGPDVEQRFQDCLGRIARLFGYCQAPNP